MVPVCKLDQLGLRDAAGAEDGDLWQRAAHHGDLVAGVEARAGLAVLVDLVGQGGAVDDAEAEVEEEVGDAGEEADGGDGLLFGFFEQGTKEPAAGALAFGFGLDDDGADLGEVRAVEVERSAAEEDAGSRIRLRRSHGRSRRSRRSCGGAGCRRRRES